VRVLGIDPGSRRTGWGLVEERHGEIFGLASGVAASGAGEISRRLGVIALRIEALLDEWQPDAVALERAFLGKNVSSALRLGEVRGVVLAGAGRRGLPVVDYTPATVKVAVAGSGCAEKSMVARGVGALLGSDVRPGDAADALAVAICHLRHARFTSRLQSATLGAARPRLRVRRVVR
jgi:crossover junction endodeoxyribonuclease RuvC